MNQNQTDQRMAIIGRTMNIDVTEQNEIKLYIYGDGLTETFGITYMSRD